MDMRSRAFWFAVSLIAFTVLILPTANAYVDPGSGSFVFQALIGGLLAMGVALKVFWGRIVGFFTRRPSEHPRSPEPES
jgi:hypothetical protein